MYRTKFDVLADMIRASLLGLCVGAITVLLMFDDITSTVKTAIVSMAGALVSGPRGQSFSAVWAAAKSDIAQAFGPLHYYTFFAASLAASMVLFWIFEYMSKRHEVEVKK